MPLGRRGWSSQVIKKNVTEYHEELKESRSFGAVFYIESRTRSSEGAYIRFFRKTLQISALRRFENLSIEL